MFGQKISSIQPIGRRSEIRGDVYFRQKSMALKACFKGFEQNIKENCKNLIRIKKSKVWTTEIGACFLVYLKLKTWIVLFFLLFTSTFSSVLKKKNIYIYIYIYIYTKLRTNWVKPHQNRINFLRSKRMCEENVFPDGGEGPCTIINVKEP